MKQVLCLKLITLPALAVVAACQEKATPPAPQQKVSEEQVAPKQSDLMARVDLRPSSVVASSKIPGVKFISLANLPNAPQLTGRGQSDCPSPVDEPKTGAGRQAKAKGWAISSEEQIGEFTSVVIASRYDWAAGGICVASNGMVAIFRDEKLAAIMYLTDPADPRELAWQIGGQSRVNGTLRMEPGMPSPPWGDIRFQHDQLTLTPVAAIDLVCGGRNRVPNVFEQPVSKSRVSLAKYGWRPVPHKFDPDGGWDVARYFEKGVIEVDSCTGGGVALCAFQYKSGNAMLQTVTLEEAGDRPPYVFGYSVECS